MDEGRRQKVLVMTTQSASLRSEAIGWTAEDGEEARKHARGGRPVGLMGYYRDWCQYETPYHAIGNKWKLLSPPTQGLLEKDMAYWSWWFVK